MVSVEFSSLASAHTTPEGRASFPRKQFAGRFNLWSPDWEKRVLMSNVELRASALLLTELVYRTGAPGAQFKNSDAYLLFEGAEAYQLVQADFHTRLAFTEQSFIARSITVPTIGVTTVAEALEFRRNPADPFWAAVGLPGVPLAIGVNASLRTVDNACELLAFKGANAQGEMGSTVGPPISAGAKVDPNTLDLDGLTLGGLLDCAMGAAALRELEQVPQPRFSRRAAWLDASRGHKPEVNYRSSIRTVDLDTYRQAVCKQHAGCLTVCGHMGVDGAISAEAISELERWGLNFQAWFLWEQPQ